MNADTFPKHIDKVAANYQEIIESSRENGSDVEALIIHSGSEAHYFADDRNVAFQAFGHYLQWVPVNRPDQFVCIYPGKRPIYFQIIPDDYWYDQSIENDNWWASEFDIIRLTSIDLVQNHLPDAQLAYLGPDSECALGLGIEPHRINPQELLARLDYRRAYKTAYEIDQLKEANRIALLGHHAAQDMFLKGGNEYQIHMAYLQACDMLEDESPYTNIVALDRNAAILHYQHKSRSSAADSKVLLIDAGCRVNGYGSDITRTSIKASVPKTFSNLLEGMETIEQDLVAMVKPGLNYQDIHSSALEKISQLLLDLEVCTGSVSDMIEKQISHLFMPHGVGHLLGIQVHDVGGHQQDELGTMKPPPEHSPALRNTRVLEQNMVFTIEPGCYFIPLLLEPERNKAGAKDRGTHINWALIDELYAYGGIRIEDNVLVTESGVANLTRQ